MQAKRPHHDQTLPVLGVLGAFPHFGKSGCKSEESNFCNLWRIVKLVKTLQSNWKVPGSTSLGTQLGVEIQLCCVAPRYLQAKKLIPKCRD